MRTPSDMGAQADIELAGAVQEYSSRGDTSGVMSPGVFSNRTAGHRSAGLPANEGAQRRNYAPVDGHQPARRARKFPLGEIREDSDPREADDQEGADQHHTELREEEKAATVRTADRHDRMYNKIHPL